MADQILRIKDGNGDTHDLAFPIVGGTDYGLLTLARNPDSNNQFGTATSVSPGSTVALVTYTAVAGFRVRGFNATGTGDGYFLLEINNSPILSGRIHMMEKTIAPSLFYADSVAAGIVVKLSVKNESDTICSYEATLIGE